MSHTSLSPSHNPFVPGSLFGLSVFGHDIIIHRYHTIHRPYYNHCVLYIAHQMFPQEDIPRGVQG